MLIARGYAESGPEPRLNLQRVDQLEEAEELLVTVTEVMLGDDRSADQVVGSEQAGGAVGTSASSDSRSASESSRGTSFGLGTRKARSLQAIPYPGH
jgi:hypothetical protein